MLIEAYSRIKMRATDCFEHACHLVGGVKSYAQLCACVVLQNTAVCHMMAIMYREPGPQLRSRGATENTSRLVGLVVTCVKGIDINTYN